MDKDKKEKSRQKIVHDTFNSVTQKEKVENQNQTHNVKKIGISKKNQNR